MSDIPYATEKGLRALLPKRDENLQLINGVLGLSDGEGVVFLDHLAENVPAMIADGYGEDRFGDVFYNDHLSSLASRIQRLAEEEPGFVAGLNALFFGSRVISIRPTTNVDGMGDKYYQSTLTAEGNLEIEYRRFYCNLNEIGADLSVLVKAYVRANAAPGIFSFVSGEPSAASMKPKVQALAEQLEIFLPEFIDVIGDFAELSDTLEKSGYESDRFDEVFYDAFMDNLLSNLKTLMEEDPGHFLALFKTRFAGRMIVLQPFSNEEAETVNGYYQTSFSPEGGLVIKFRRNNVT